MSQITKPMALDETLQDVVTAIQGITQGGMIVSTGTVGSATQPVYIDGGVPTAITGALAKANGGTGNTIGKGESVNVVRIPNDGNVNVDTFTTDTKDTAQFHIAAGSATNSPDSAWYNYLTMSASGTGADYATQFAFGATWARLWFRNKNAGTWQPWHQIYGITTGNATLNSSYIDAGSVSYVKSGNVVVVNMDGVHLKANVPTGTTLFSNLPQNAISRNRLWIDAALDTTHDNFLCNMTNSGILALAGAQAMPTGRYLYGSFTYMTND